MNGGWEEMIRELRLADEPETAKAMEEMLELLKLWAGDDDGWMARDLLSEDPYEL